MKCAQAQEHTGEHEAADLGSQWSQCDAGSFLMSNKTQAETIVWSPRHNRGGVPFVGSLFGAAPVRGLEPRLAPQVDQPIEGAERLCISKGLSLVRA